LLITCGNPVEKYIIAFQEKAGRLFSPESNYCKRRVLVLCYVQVICFLIPYLAVERITEYNMWTVIPPVDLENLLTVYILWYYSFTNKL
jgi:hypothetical protein